MNEITINHAHRTKILKFNDKFKRKTDKAASKVKQLNAKLESLLKEINYNDL